MMNYFFLMLENKKKFCKACIKWILMVTAFCLFLNNYREIPVDKHKLMGYDFRLFQGTEAWELAKAVEDGDTIKINKILKQDPHLINIQDSTYHETLLMTLALDLFQLGFYNDPRPVKSLKCLLNNGADPNICDDYGGTALINACYSCHRNPEYFRLLLAYGADPNYTVPGNVSPLMMATAKNVECVKILLDYGADINYVTTGSKLTVLSFALIHENWDIALYLMDNGADINVPLFYRTNNNDTIPIYIETFLREQRYPLGSKNHKGKWKIINYIENKGRSYRNAPINEHAIEWAKREYPDSWQKALEEY